MQLVCITVWKYHLKKTINVMCSTIIESMFMSLMAELRLKITELRMTIEKLERVIQSIRTVIDYDGTMIP